MAQIFLYRLYIVPGFDGGHGIRVPEIVKAGFRASNFLHYLFEILVYGNMGQMLPQFIREHKAGILPAFAVSQPVLQLRALDVFQSGDNERGYCDCAAFAVLCGRKTVFAIGSTDQLELLIYEDRAFVQVYTVPCQPQDFALPHSCEQGDGKQALIFVTLYGLQEGRYLAFIKRLDFLFDNAGMYTSMRRIKSDIAVCHGLLEGCMEDAVNVLEVFGESASRPSAASERLL